MENSQLLSIVRSFIGYCTAQSDSERWCRHCRLSRWCQLCGWCVCVVCVCESVCVKRSRLSTRCRSFCTSSTLMNVQLGDETCPNYAGRLLSCRRVSHLYRRDVEPWHHPNTPGGIQPHNNKTNDNKLHRFGSCMLNTLFILYPFLSSRFFTLRLIRTSEHQTRREILFFF